MSPLHCLVELCSLMFYSFLLCFLFVGESLFCGVIITIIFVFRYRGIYHDLDVSVKIIRSEQLNEALKVEFAQEVMILR